MVRLTYMLWVVFWVSCEGEAGLDLHAEKKKWDNGEFWNYNKKVSKLG